MSVSLDLTVLLFSRQARRQQLHLQRGVAQHQDPCQRRRVLHRHATGFRGFRTRAYEQPALMEDGIGADRF
jgi:hypothetical protein